eukprot:1148683-Pelagomonas_calceolata.AAC.6
MHSRAPRDLSCQNLSSRPQPYKSAAYAHLALENVCKGLQGFTMVAYSPRLWLMAAGETSSTSIKN